MKVHHSILIICMFLSLTLLFASGIVSRDSIFEFVFVEVSVGMKIQKGRPDGAFEENQKRLFVVQQQADTLAVRIMNAITAQADSIGIKDSITFGQVEPEYQLFRKSMKGYKRFPTLSTEEEVRQNGGQTAYVQLSEKPVVVCRFLQLPDMNILNKLKKIVAEAVQMSEQ